MKTFRSLILLSVLVSSILFFSLNSCTDKERISPDGNSGVLVTPRGSTAILPDSFFQLHNDFILWVFDNYMDSVDYYEDPRDFADFTSRKWFLFTGEEVDIAEEVFEDNELILSEPYYTYNEGYTNENLLDDHFSSTELGYLNTTMDSIYSAIENDESEATIQLLINNGMKRINTISPVNKFGLLNSLKQESYSVTLGFELYDLYPSPSPQPYLWCILYAITADNEAYLLFEAFDSDGGASGHLSAIVYISIESLRQCVQN